MPAAGQPRGAHPTRGARGGPGGGDGDGSAGFAAIPPGRGFGGLAGCVAWALRARLANGTRRAAAPLKRVPPAGETRLAGRGRREVPPNPCRQPAAGRGGTRGDTRLWFSQAALAGHCPRAAFPASVLTRRSCRDANACRPAAKVISSGMDATAALKQEVGFCAHKQGRLGRWLLLPSRPSKPSLLGSHTGHLCDPRGGHHMDCESCTPRLVKTGGS